MVLVDGLECAPETGDTGRGQDGGLTMPMPGHAWVVHSTLVETTYFCASLRPSHEMRAGPVDLLPLCSFDDGSVSAETKSHHRSQPGYGDGLPLMRMFSGGRTSMGEYIIRWETNGSNRAARH